MSETICGCCNIFNLSKGLTIAELVLSILGFIGIIFSAVRTTFIIVSSVLACGFLILEIVGIAYRNYVIVIITCVIRILEVIGDIALIALFGIGMKEITKQLEYARTRDPDAIEYVQHAKIGM